MAFRTNIFFHGATAQVGQGILIAEDSWSHPVRYTTLGGTPLDEWSADIETSVNTKHPQECNYVARTT
jgi:hypothetical protein